MTLYERLHPNARRACHTPNCEREAIRDGAYCRPCTDTVWTTGRPPEIVVPEWLKRSRAGLVDLGRDETGLGLAL